MGPKRKSGKRMSPAKRAKICTALESVSRHRSSIKKAARDNGLSYSFLYRRYMGEVGLYKVKGPKTIFTEEEEKAMANWLQEMAQRGMGLRMCEFLDFIEELVKKEKRKTPFKNGRPGKKWYYAFLARNSDIIASRTETPLELKRSKVTKEKTDEWYRKFQDFLENKDLLHKPHKIWNADETGFTMGYNKSKVIGPSRKEVTVPSIASGKQRLTVMFCCNAAGQMMPPFHVYPEPKPRGYNPLNGCIDGSDIAYTPKGWMDTVTFSMFIDHFDKHAGQERPVVLLFDSVSSHVNHDVFMKAVSKGIELYRIVPNATHLMQPLDKGVFGPLKAKWHLTARKYMRDNPGQNIRKENFAEKLRETFFQFYKPLTIINAFKSSGIYPVDSNAITHDMLKPSLTYAETDESGQESLVSEEQKNAKGAFEVLEKALTTPVRRRYSARLEEGYDVEGQSPCYDVYKKLYYKANKITNVPKAKGGLELLAEIAISQNSDPQPGPSNQDESNVSPVLIQSLKFPKAPEIKKPVRKTLVNELPDNLTSPECIRKLSLKQLEKIKNFADQEKKSKVKFLKKTGKSNNSTGKSKGDTGKGPLRSSKRGKAPAKGSKKKEVSGNSGYDEENPSCIACNITWKEDMDLSLTRTWIQCDVCSLWVHVECLSFEVQENAAFTCPECEK